MAAARGRLGARPGAPKPDRHGAGSGRFVLRRNADAHGQICAERGIRTEEIARFGRSPGAGCVVPGAARAAGAVGTRAARPGVHRVFQRYAGRYGREKTAHERSSAKFPASARPKPPGMARRFCPKSERTRHKKSGARGVPDFFHLFTSAAIHPLLRPAAGPADPARCSAGS